MDHSMGKCVNDSFDIAILACMLNHLEYYQGREYILYVFTKTAVKTLGCIVWLKFKLDNTFIIESVDMICDTPIYVIQHKSLKTQPR